MPWPQILYWFWKLWCTDCSKCLEPKASGMHFWQGTNKCKNRVLKYQNENINKPGRKKKFLVGKVFNCYSYTYNSCFQSFKWKVWCIGIPYFKNFCYMDTFLYHELPLYFPFPSQKLGRKYLPKVLKNIQQHE